MESLPFWVGFNLIIVVLILVDLRVLRGSVEEIEVRSSLLWSLVWILLALAFGGALYVWRGPEDALAYLTGYLIEKSLSLDNIFVFWMIFVALGIEARYQQRVLLWGVLGALVLRLIFILIGVTLVEMFRPILYIFGFFLLLSGVQMLFHKEKKVDPEKSRLLRLVRRWLPVTKEMAGERFFLRRNGQLYATPLFVALVLVEGSDVLFAVDSIPAIMAVTLDPFLIYTSNVFAILGLRALYFALAALVRFFGYLHYGLAAVLVYVGAKMVLVDLVHIPTPVSLAVILFCLGGAILASALWPPQAKGQPAPLGEGRGGGGR